jgi:hypothetical protein
MDPTVARQVPLIDQKILVWGLTTAKRFFKLCSRMVPSPRSCVIAAFVVTGALVVAGPAMAQQEGTQQTQQQQQQQPQYTTPQYTTPQYTTPQYTTPPGGGKAPAGGGGKTPSTKPTSPGAGGAPGNAGGAPQTTGTLPAGTLPLTGFADGVFLAMLGFVLLLAGMTLRRVLRPRSSLA